MGAFNDLISRWIFVGSQLHYECAALPTELQRRRGRDYNLNARRKQAAKD